jgi:sterol desaturase/sphingolipid hydroxylase (fatty acid hydroxylase superfamily)
LTELGHSIAASLATASDGELVSAFAVGLVVIVAVGESAVRRQQVSHAGRRLAVASMLGLVGLVVSAALGGLLGFLFLGWGRMAPPVLVDLWASHPVIGWVTGFVAFDGMGHVHHRIGHETGVGRAAHAPHHSDPVFQASLAFRQSWLPIHGLVVFPLVALGGWSIGTIVGCAALSNLLQALQHVSSAPSLPRWIRAVVITPREHRIHHDRDESINLGPIFTVWDRWSGTYQRGESATDGQHEVGPPVSVMAAQFGGWREFFERRPASLR